LACLFFVVFEYLIILDYGLLASSYRNGGAALVFGREKDTDGGKMKFSDHLILDVALGGGGKRKKCGFNFFVFAP